jgi:hypothetical protein
MRQAIALLLSISCFSLFAQDEIKKSKPVLGGGIYLMPTQLIFPEVILTYEHFVKNRLSLSYSLGYKIPVGEGSEIKHNQYGLIHGISIEMPYKYRYMFNPFSEAFYASIAPAYYLNRPRKRMLYIQLEIFNRFYWIDKRQLSYNQHHVKKGGTYHPNTDESFNSIRSEQINVTGAKLLFGINGKVSISKSTFLNFKAHTGIGYRYKTYHFENIDNNFKRFGITPVYEEYSEEKGEQDSFSLHWGVKIGVAKKQQIKTQQI